MGRFRAEAWIALAVVLSGVVYGLMPRVMRLFTAPLATWQRSAEVLRLGAEAQLASRNRADFEGGNIGKIERPSADTVNLELRSDNDDALPKYWRQWFYLRLTDVPTDRVVTVNLGGEGQWSYFLPFYSYDNKTWHQFPASEVTQPTKLSVRMRHRFNQRTVWLARFNPYTYSTLKEYLSRLRKRPDVLVQTIGLSPEGRPVPLVTVTDNQPLTGKARVVIHARTHPGEVGSSFLLEGLLDFLASDAPLAKRMRAKLIFTVLPMLNIDGVVAGNNRVSPRGVNLEGKWYPPEPAPAAAGKAVPASRRAAAADDGDDLAIDDERAPPEVRLFHDHLVALLRRSKTKVPVTLALNLHSSAGEPQDNIFIFPHFGPRSRGYKPDEANLYYKQTTFISDLCSLQGKDWFNPPPADGTRAFLRKSVPESWWWRNFHDQVTALTIESTYGLAGRTGRWVNAEDMRRLGVSVARAIAKFHGLMGPRGAAAMRMAEDLEVAH